MVTLLKCQPENYDHLLKNTNNFTLAVTMHGKGITGTAKQPGPGTGLKSAMAVQLVQQWSESNAAILCHLRGRMVFIASCAR